MKKASVKFAAKSRAEKFEEFQPLYLFVSQDPEPSKQIHIFINSSKRSCYIQEKTVWQELTINHSLLGSQKETYYFQAGNSYHYLEVGHDDAYLSLADSERKIFLKNLSLSQEILHELAPPNLEQLNLSAIAKTKLDAEKILKLTRRMARMNTEIISFEKILPALIDARSAMERLDNDKQKEFIVDLDDQIKWFKRQKHHSEYLKLIAQTKKQVILTINKQQDLKDYEKALRELNVQKKEVTRALQDQQLAVAKLKKVTECFIDLPSYLIEALFIEQVNQQIRLIEKNLQNNTSRLEKIEEKIKVLTNPESSENTEVANQPIQSLFFNGIIPNPIQCSETELQKSYSLNLL